MLRPQVRFNANQKIGFDFVSFPSHTLRERFFWLWDANALFISNII
jgi:hypothetical protein